MKDLKFTVITLVSLIAVMFILFYIETVKRFDEYEAHVKYLDSPQGIADIREESIRLCREGMIRLVDEDLKNYGRVMFNPADLRCDEI